MTCSEVWRIISSNLDELMRFRKRYYCNMEKPYTHDELTAQVMAFESLRKMDEEVSK